MMKELREQATHRLTLRFGVEELMKEKEIAVPDAEVDGLLASALATMPEEQRKEATARYAKGTDGYEELRWRRMVEKLVEDLLKA